MSIFAIILFLIAGQEPTAQQYTFRVLITKGGNEVKVGNEWTALKVGATLQSADEVRIGRNGYLGLVHVSGKPLEVKDAGRHQVADLAGRIGEGTSVLHKYTDFILSARPSDETNLTVTGSVYRGTDDIDVFLPQEQKAVIFNDEVTIPWNKVDGTSSYVVQFNSMFGDELYRTTVRDTALTINLSDPQFVDEDNIVIRVVSAANSRVTSEDFILKKVSAADKKRITSALSEIAAVTGEENALNLLFLAAFYEENALLIDASTAYRQAVRLAPEVPYYRQAYELFIKRNGLF